MKPLCYLIMSCLFGCAQRDVPGNRPPPPKRIILIIDGKEFVTTDRFVPGAIGSIGKRHFPPKGVDAERLEQARGHLREGRVETLLQETPLYFREVLQLSMSDDPRIAKNAFRFFNQFCIRYEFTNSDTGKAFQVDPRALNSPENRATNYLMFDAYWHLLVEQLNR